MVNGDMQRQVEELHKQVSGRWHGFFGLPDLAIERDAANLGGLVLGCIEAKFCK